MRSWLQRSPQNEMESTPRRSRRRPSDSFRRPAFRAGLEALEKRVLLAADLTVTKTADVANPVPGQVIDYTISVQNVGTTAASASTVTDSLPAGMTLIAASTDTGSVTASGGTVSGDLGTIAAAGAATVHVFASVDTGTTGLLANNVSVSSPDDTNTANNSATADVTASAAAGTAADLSLGASGLPASMTVGQQGTLTLTVTNISANSASNVQLMGMLPSGVSLLSASASGSGTVTENNGLLTANLGTLAPGGSATVTLVELAAAPGSVNETATATTSSGDSNTANNSATASTTIDPAGSAAADLAVTKTAAASGTVGSDLTYTITVTNDSATNTATASTLTDALPLGLTFVSATSTAGSVSASGGIVTANLGDLAPGASDTITLVGLPTVAGTLTNTAVASTTAGDTNVANNTATATTLISAPAEADVSITKIATPDPDTVGQNLTYTITVQNTGGTDAAGTVVTDALPAGVTYVSSSSSAGSVSNSGGTITANLGTLAAGATDTISIVVTPNAAGTLVNSASVTTTSPNSSQNTTATVSSTVIVSGAGGAAGCYLAGQPGDGSDATFVTNLYRELLGRDPDSGGQAFWVNYLNHDGLANHLNNPRREQVIQSFMASQEYRDHLVTCMYEKFLNRAPDAGGLQFFVTQLAAGVDERILLSEIVGSQEYFIINGNTNAGFVDALYRDLLGRAADPGGAAYWANLAAQAGPSHDNLVREMLGSPEAEHDLLMNSSSSGLSQVTGGGWENLYFQGNVPNAGGSNDVFYQKLQASTPWDDVIEDMLASNHYYDSSKSI